MESSTLDGNWRNATQEDPPPAPGNPSAFAPPHGLVDGRYRIERELGRGGMGRVYVARDERLLREVALKVLAPGHHDDVRLRRFEHEARAAGSLQHPNILVVHDVGMHEREPYIITELLEGETLRELLRKRPREPEEAVALALQIAHGLAAAHEHGIVHRDLKPENLFLTKDGTVKILDFGVARLPDDFSAGDGSCTVTGAVLGTVSYMAPEQVRGQQVDARADLFAFGSVLHEMLSGSSPFARSTALETAHAILADPPAPLPGGVPAPLARIVERCLEKDPSDRFASARELVQALSPPARARRWTTAIAAGMLATAIAVAVLLLPLPHPGPPSRRIVVAAADFSNETEEKDLNGLSGMLITSLEQSKRLSVLTRGHMFDVLKQIGRGDVERIDEALGREICKQANADALVLAGIRRFGEVYAIDVKVLDPVKNEYLFTTGEQGKGKESIPAMIDRLSARTRAGLREKAEEIRAASVPVAQTTTANLEAYQFYFQGERSFSLARFGEAVSDFRRAIQLDPKFALAHFALGEALSWTLLMPGTGRAEPAEALKTAVRLGLPEKEGCLAQAELARRRNEWERAIALVDACAARFPEHKLTLLTAGDWRFHRNDVHGAARYLEKTVALDPTFKPAVEHLLALWQVMERPDKALELGRAFAGRVHDEEAYPLLAFAQQVAGDPQGAIATLRESARLFPLSAGPPFGLATAYLFAGDPDQAKIELQPVLDGKYGEKDGGAAYWLDVYGGRFRAAVARLDDRMLRARRAADSPRAGSIAFAKGWTLASGTGDFPSARTAAGEVLEMGGVPFVIYIETGDIERATAMFENNSASLSYADPVLDALRERKRGATAEAVAKYQVLARAPYMKHWWLYRLAELHLDRNEPRSAIDALRRLQVLFPAGAEFGWFLFYYPRSFHLLGRAYERAGDAPAARAAYQRFLTLWKDADPDLEELRDGQARLAALQAR